MLLGSDSGDQANLGPLTDNAKKLGLNLVSSESVALTTADFTPVMEKMRQAGAAAVYVKIDSLPAYVNVMKAVQQLGWKDVQILAGPTAANADVLSAIPAPVRNQFHAQGAAPYRQGFGGDNQLFQKFATQLSANGPISDIGIAVNYADNISLGIWAYQKAGSNDPDKMKAALESIGDGDLPASVLMEMPQPHYTAQVHDLTVADFSKFWALLEPGDAKNNQWPGVELSVPKKL
jgi:hypothetical protein